MKPCLSSRIASSNNKKNRQIKFALKKQILKVKYPNNNSLDEIGLKKSTDTNTYLNMNNPLFKENFAQSLDTNLNVEHVHHHHHRGGIMTISPYLVKVRAVFLKVGDIDTLNEKFMAEAFIEASWIDSALDPETNYNAELHWNPKLYVLNCLGDLKQQIWYNQYSISEYEKDQKENRNSCNEANMASYCHESLINENLQLQGVRTSQQQHHLHTSSEPNLLFNSKSKNGSVIVERRRITGKFWQILDLKDFPADVQNLTITLTTPKQNNEIELIHCKEKASSVNTKCFASSQEWLLYRHISVREFLRDSVFSKETFPAIDLTINAARRPTFYYWNAFFLIFLITISSLSIFSIRCHLVQHRIQNTCTLLLTSVTFKWITNRSLPTVSYMTSLDKYSLTCMLFLCITILWHSSISATMGVDQTCDYPISLYDHMAFVFFCFVFLLIHFVFIFWLIRIGYSKRRHLNKKELDYANATMGKRSTRLKSMLYGI